MGNIEELLRDAFRAGMSKGSHQSYFDAPLDETEYIDSIKDELKLFLTDVSQQRELLLAYHKHLDSFNDPTIYNASEEMIDDYLANN